jgi:hypothetical protein
VIGPWERVQVAFEKIDNVFETIAYFLAVSALELSACLNRRFNNQFVPGMYWTT